MLLTIDVGNTNITLGLYDGETLGPRWRLATVHDRMPDEYGLQFLGLLTHVECSPDDLTGICLASVVPPLTGIVIEACRSYLGWEPLVIDTGVKTGVRIRYEDPRAVGADRIVDAAAVQRLYGGPACVVDFGTATTFDAISGRGRLPGRRHRPRHQHRRRSALPAHRQAAARRSAATSGCYRAQHNPCHAVRPAIRLCLPGGGDGGALPQGAGAGDEGHRHRRPGGGDRPRDGCDQDHRSLAHPGWSAHRLGDEQTVISSINTVVLPAADPNSLQQALEILQQGGLVAFPTDTVYGLGALVYDPRSIERLYAVKGRESSKAIPILISDMEDLSQVADHMDARTRRLAERFWPGPLTLVVPRHPSLPEALTPYATVGVRMPDHPAALALIRHTGPLAATSANLSGQPSARTAAEVLASLEGRIDLVLDGGATPGGVSSTVVDCSGPELAILRQGPITLDELLSE